MTIINSQVIIGKGCIVNTGAIIDHECEIGDFSHIAPGATLSGNVKVGKSCFIGANSTVIQGVKIGNNVIIGAGAVVIKDVPDNITIVGNPAKIIKLWYLCQYPILVEMNWNMFFIINFAIILTWLG